MSRCSLFSYSNAFTFMLQTATSTESEGSCAVINHWNSPPAAYTVVHTSRLLYNSLADCCCMNRFSVGQQYLLISMMSRVATVGRLAFKTTVHGASVFPSCINSPTLKRAQPNPRPTAFSFWPFGPLLIVHKIASQNSTISYITSELNLVGLYKLTFGAIRVPRTLHRKCEMKISYIYAIIEVEP